jgi:hypothetical protein
MAPISVERAITIGVLLIRPFPIESAAVEPISAELIPEPVSAVLVAARWTSPKRTTPTCLSRGKKACESKFDRVLPSVVEAPRPVISVIAGSE